MKKEDLSKAIANNEEILSILKIIKDEANKAIEDLAPFTFENNGYKDGEEVSVDTLKQYSAVMLTTVQHGLRVSKVLQNILLLSKENRKILVENMSIGDRAKYERMKEVVDILFDFISSGPEKEISIEELDSIRELSSERKDEIKAEFNKMQADNPDKKVILIESPFGIGLGFKKE